MPDRKFIKDMPSWKRLGRRWTAILVAMLGTNFCLIVLAMAGYGGGTHTAAQNGSIAAEVGAAVNDATVSGSGEEISGGSEPGTVEQQAAETAEITATVISSPAVSSPAAVPSPIPADATANSKEESQLANVQEAAPAVSSSADTAVPSVTTETAPNVAVDNGIVIVNPKMTGGAIHFVVEKEVYSLEPGTYCRFPGNEPKKVVFHKGDDESDAEHELFTGLFAFTVGTAGWELSLVDANDSQKVLRGCKLAAE